jgi:hypothetical protein
MNDTDARLWHPWLRINRVLCAITKALPYLGLTTRVTLFAAFFLEHRRCGDLDGGVESDRVWMSCTCGVVISRNADRD